MQAQFISSVDKKIFTLYFPGETSVRTKKAVLLIPPFAEEMNKSRKMFTELAKRMSLQGVDVLLFDFYGTGDSEGDFSQATIALWRENVSTCYQWLKQQGDVENIDIVALRAGSLLAIDFVSSSSQLNINKLILWQPVFNGKQFIGQFFRLRLAASMMENGDKKESLQSLKQQLNDEGFIEIAGYRLSQTLVEEFEGLNFTTSDKLSVEKIEWLEVGMPPRTDLLPISQKIITAWQDKTQLVASHFIQGSTFWQTQEITLSEALLRKTLSFYS